MNSLGEEWKCPICGKIFLANEPWGYARNKRKMCSWTCLRKYDAKSRRERSTQHIGDKERAEIMVLLKEGLKPQKVADTVGVTIQTVIYYQKKIGA